MRRGAGRERPAGAGARRLGLAGRDQWQSGSADPGYRRRADAADRDGRRAGRHAARSAPRNPHLRHRRPEHCRRCSGVQLRHRWRLSAGAKRHGRAVRAADSAGGRPLDGLLGADMLSAFDVDLDTRDGRADAVSGARLPAGGAALAGGVPVDGRGAGGSADRLLVPIVLDGAAGVATLDTGAQHTAISASTGRARRRVAAGMAQDPTITAHSAAAEQIAVRVHRFRRLQIGPAESDGSGAAGAADAGGARRRPGRRGLHGRAAALAVLCVVAGVPHAERGILGGGGGGDERRGFCPPQRCAGQAAHDEKCQRSARAATASRRALHTDAPAKGDDVRRAQAVAQALVHREDTPRVDPGRQRIPGELDARRWRSRRPRQGPAAPPDCRATRRAAGAGPSATGRRRRTPPLRTRSPWSG